MPALPELRKLPVEDVPVPKNLCQLRDPAEVPVVTVVLAGQHSMQRMVEIVIPAGVDAVPVLLPRPANARVVAVALGN